ncbi:GNAT family N-acetyltransferase [Deinococcus sp.]|uniref:GNAT family N-acetyltransferase n=1 Tax=Deinococcus sp. TaxID=47478 RepID=UPI0025B9BDE2|nr:GNAT family N-acetyltransferase [Deinococcus sp.]
MPIIVRRITDPADPALAAFGRIQESSYYAPEMLISPAYFPRLLNGGTGRDDRILVAESGAGDVLGGTIYSLLSAAGFNSFMGVSREARGRGVGRALQAASVDELRRAGMPGMFADSVYAARQNAAERAGETRVGTEPHERRMVLGALGFLTVDLPYWQPVGGENGGPLTNLDLLYCPLEPAQTVPLALVTATVQDYWRGWLGPERAAAEAGALAERAGNVPEQRLLPATETPAYWLQAH